MSIWKETMTDYSNSAGWANLHALGTDVKSGLLVGHSCRTWWASQCPGNWIPSHSEAVCAKWWGVGGYHFAWIQGHWCCSNRLTIFLQYGWTTVCIHCIPNKELAHNLAGRHAKPPWPWVIFLSFRHSGARYDNCGHSQMALSLPKDVVKWSRPVCIQIKHNLFGSLETKKHQCANTKFNCKSVVKSSGQCSNEMWSEIQLFPCNSGNALLLSKLKNHSVRSK